MDGHSLPAVKQMVILRFDHLFGWDNNNNNSELRLRKKKKKNVEKKQITSIYGIH